MIREVRDVNLFVSDAHNTLSIVVPPTVASRWIVLRSTACATPGHRNCHPQPLAHQHHGRAFLEGRLHPISHLARNT